jgi:predicted transcriptional regulator
METASPTQAELEILDVLWKHGPATVRQIHNIIAAARGVGYSTTLKMVQIMTEKGLLSKDESVRPQIYTPSRPQEQTQLQLVDELIQRAFGGSASKLVMRAMSVKRIDQRELDEIKRMIGQAKKRKS